MLFSWIIQTGDQIKKEFRVHPPAYYSGYKLDVKNDNQSKLAVSFNSIEGYIRDLRNATEQTNEAFSEIPLKTGGFFNQLNRNQLQIEDEYYAIARPKSNALMNTRQIHNIGNTGINYIELRSIDLNPFNPIGIDQDTLNFLEIFSLYCTLKESKKISSDEFNLYDSIASSNIESIL